jgi:hypothetical protein
MFSLLFWGLTLGIIGKVLLGLSVVLVHTKITKEKHIDGLVLLEMRKERKMAILGIILMVVGYVLELSFFGAVEGISLFGF